jgi:hypothetical protein
MQHWISSFAVINCRIQLTFWIDDKSSYRKYHTRLFIVADRTFIHGLRFNCERESHFGHCIGSSGAINTEYVKRGEKSLRSCISKFWQSLHNPLESFHPLLC